VSARGAYRSATFVFSAVMVVLGVLVLVRTASAGGGGIALGYVIGVAFIAAGVLRLVVLRRMS
jgi:uncharacterized membrane protein HdeD (DUF308 family)